MAIEQGGLTIDMGKDGFATVLEDHLACMRHLEDIGEIIEQAAAALIKVIAGDGRIFVCGNGGSAADAQHFAAELVGRFEQERRALPAIALTTDTSIISAVANDYSFEAVFARQLAGLARPQDALVAISTSGRSANVLEALKLATDLEMTTVALTGAGGGQLKNQAVYTIVAGAENTARVQEAHILILHYFAQRIEKAVIGIKAND